MENGTKLRLVYLYQYLIRHTDFEHQLSTAELTRILKEKYGITCARNTISNDLAILRESDRHICFTASTQNKYYYDGQPFELSQLKILVDAIAAAKFINASISRQLIAKLLTLTTEENAMQLRRHVDVEGFVKSESLAGYGGVDVVNSAIDLHRKIQFCYVDYDTNKNQILMNNGFPYTVSPYELIWDGDFYYMRGYCDERKQMRNFRLDRISGEPILLNEIAAILPEDYNPAEYHKAVFRMMDTDEPSVVDLLCDGSVMKYLIDNFGKDVNTEAVDAEQFIAHIRVCTSPTFYRWIFGFTGKIRILGPETVLNEYKEILRTAMAAY